MDLYMVMVRLFCIKYIYLKYFLNKVFGMMEYRNMLMEDGIIFFFLSKMKIIINFWKYNYRENDELK